MFRLQNNVPDIYINSSRDFQLLCRLYDVINNGVLSDIESMTYVNDAMQINERLLDLYATKVGFYRQEEINTLVLRYILNSFPYIVKNKGNLKGIRAAAIVVLKAEGIIIPPEVDIDNINHSVNIYIFGHIRSYIVLEDVLRYVLPLGYTVFISEAIQDDAGATKISTSDSIKASISAIVNNSQTTGNRTGNDFVLTGVPFTKDNITAIDGARIIGANDLMTAWENNAPKYSGGRDLIDADKSGATSKEKTANIDYIKELP